MTSRICAAAMKQYLDGILPHPRSISDQYLPAINLAGQSFPRFGVELLRLHELHFFVGPGLGFLPDRPRQRMLAAAFCRTGELVEVPLT